MAHATSPFARVRAWLVVAGCLVVMFAISSLPAARVPPHPLPDKMVHMIEYAGLGWVLAHAFGTLPRLRGVLASGLAAVAFGVLVAILEEAYQSRIPGREVSTGDVGADTLGLLLAQIARAWLARQATGGVA